MSDLGDIVSAVRDLLAGLQSGGTDLFAAVELHQGSERKAASEAIARLRTPAALLLYEGRARGDSAPWTGADATISVLLAVENLRGGDAALAGGAGQTGAFDMLGLVSGALDGVVVESEYQLGAIDEHPFGGDERRVVFEQRYRVQRLAEIAAPTFGGAVITGADSIVSVVPGQVSVEAVAFGFPGIDGAYRHLTGVKGRAITWSGWLRADDDAALALIEADLEARVASGQVATMVDAWGRSLPECVMDSFERRGPRRRHAVSGWVVQEFELTLTQLRT